MFENYDNFIAKFNESASSFFGKRMDSDPSHFIYKVKNRKIDSRYIGVFYKAVGGGVDYVFIDNENFDCRNVYAEWNDPDGSAAGLLNSRIDAKRSEYPISNKFFIRCRLDSLAGLSNFMSGLFGGKAGSGGVENSLEGLYRNIYNECDLCARNDAIDGNAFCCKIEFDNGKLIANKIRFIECYRNFKDLHKKYNLNAVIEETEFCAPNKKILVFDDDENIDHILIDIHESDEKFDGIKDGFYFSY